MVCVGHIEQSLYDKVSENNYLSNFDEIGTGIVYKMLLNKCGFYENFFLAFFSGLDKN